MNMCPEEDKDAGKKKNEKVGEKLKGESISPRVPVRPKKKG